MQLDFEVVKRFKLGEEHWWARQIEGLGYFKVSKRNNKMELNRMEEVGKRRAMWDTFRWTVSKLRIRCEWETHEQ